MIKFCTLASGSSGNAVLVCADSAVILIDCGINGKSAEEALKKVGMSPNEIDAIFVTHEHSDHISGVGVMSRRYNLPVYANVETWAAMSQKIGKILPDNRRYIKTGSSLVIKDAQVTPFDTPHDSVHSVGYRIAIGNSSFALATDIGCITQQLFDNIRSVDMLLLEANHDVDMLKKNPEYPQMLKERILGNRGHLSNPDCARVCVPLLESGVKKILLGHLSKDNNTPDTAYGAVESALNNAGAVIGRDITVRVAPRCEPSEVFSL